MLKFILGILFVKLFDPIIQCVVSIFNVKTQEYSWIVSERVAKIQANMQKMGIQLQNDEEENENPMGFQTSVVGFEVNGDEDYDYDQEGEQE